MRSLWRLGILFLAVGLIFSFGCSGGGDDDDDSGDDAAADDTGTDDDTATDDDSDDTGDDDTEIPPPVGCDTLKDGWNEGFVVDGRPRSFYIDLPDGVEESWPWPVVFNWHGYGDTARNMRTLIQGLVNNEEMPFIGITPEDTGMLFDWDIIDGANPDNREVKFFDAMLAELDKCWGVDKNRIHLTGFSFGGGVADLMGVVRGDIIASIATCSGIYGSNPANSLPEFIAVWPELTTDNKYVEMRLHGGILDNMILPFGQYGENDRIYMNQNGHDYINCIHPYSHNMGFMYMGPETFIEFFAAHPLGTTESPFKNGLPDDYKDTCSYSPKQ